MTNSQIDIDLVAADLPTEYTAAGAKIQDLIRQTGPDAVVCLGAAPGLDVISLERVALNLDDADAPDNVGERVTGRLILPAGPAAYWSTLPLERMQEALQTLGIPVTISNYAGAYVCNHAFYLARHTLEQLGSSAKCGLIHLPLIATQHTTSPAGAHALPPEIMVAGVECCLQILREEGPN
jgi:pyroglutamyl-peptidase